MAHYDPAAAAALERIAKSLDAIVPRALKIIEAVEKDIAHRDAERAKWKAEEAARAADPAHPCPECGRPR